MATLIHLNGPSGVGKSTLAQLFAEDHPGTLNLEADRVVTMIGGWKNDFFATLTPARRLATAMAEAHLETGRDVVMPQLVTSHDQVACFEEAAARARAGYLEIALLVEAHEQVRRFKSRSATSEHGEHIGQYIEAQGGATLLHRIHRHFSEYIRDRPNARYVGTQDKTVGESYDAVLATIR